MGILLFEMYTGKPPIRDNDHMEILRRIARGKFDLKGIETASPDFQNLVKNLICGEKERLGS